MTDKQEFNDLVAVGDLDIMAEAGKLSDTIDGIIEAGQPGLYDAYCDAARAIVNLPTQRERLGAVEFLAIELRGYLDGLDTLARQEIIDRLVNELRREMEA